MSAKDNVADGRLCSDPSFKFNLLGVPLSARARVALAHHSTTMVSRLRLVPRAQGNSESVIISVQRY